MNISLSAETSKKLKEMGYPQKYNDARYMIVKIKDEEYIVDYGTREEYGYEIICDSPTAQELMENMVDTIIENYNHYNLTVIKVNENYWVAYNCESKHALISFDGNSLIECLGNLWIWCKDNGYIEKKMRD